MKMKLIYPTWRKLERQTPFNLPPHGPVVFAATLPDYVDVDFLDENVEELVIDDSPDVVGLSIMLSAQLPRAYAIAGAYRDMGIPVIAGGISSTLHADEVSRHVDSVFIGETEGRMEAVLNDLKNGQLKSRYDYLKNHPPIELVGTARRDILNREKYTYRGMPLVDLVHASRGCRFNCFPCCTGYLGGKVFRPRPIDKVIEELSQIENNRLFIVDNSLAQNDAWEEELFKAMIPLKKKWVSHPIKNNDKLLKLAYEAGAWYVYQAIVDTSDVIRDRVKRYHDHGIGVEGTIILGTDDQTVDDIKRMVDFLLEINLELAEFTILTPFMQSPIRNSFAKNGRLLKNGWEDYTCDRVVFQPKQMTQEELQQSFYYAWDTFYKEKSQEVQMGNMFMKVIRREIADDTYKPVTINNDRRSITNRQAIG
ncbi:MAG: cobalamin-dependent protein [Desulfobacterales bacterium]|nr:cobalamin-dependent protein [Desulfobacterales bacterium]